MNKKISIIFFAFLMVFAFMTLASASLVVQSNPSSLTVYQSSETSSSFTLYNDGTNNITNIALTHGNLPTGVDISFNANNFNLSIGESKEITFTVSANSNAALGTEEVIINANGSNSTSFKFDLNVKENYCSEGPKGTSLRLTVDNPDTGDDFYAGDNMTIEVNVENRDNNEIDFVVEAQLYDVTTGDEIDSTDLEASLDEDDDSDYELYIEVPSDIDQDDEYVINVKVYEDGNEEEQCREDSVSIDVKKRSHGLSIEKVLLNSAEACNVPLDLTVKVENTGSNDEDDTTVTIKNQALGINLEKTQDINEGDTETFYFTGTLPVIAPGIYTLQIEVESDKASDYQELDLDLRTNCRVQVNDVSMLALQQNAANPGQDTVFKLTLTNTGNDQESYQVSAENYESWATLTGLSSTQVTLASGQSQDVIITLNPLSSTQGLKTFQAKVTFGDQTRTQDISVTVGKEDTSNTGSGFFSSLSENTWFLIINIILVLIVIGLIILLATRPKRRLIVEEPKEARLRKNGKRK